MNYLANFNLTWWETCLRDGDSDYFPKKVLDPFGAQ